MMNAEKSKKLQAQTAEVRIGGKGMSRHKKKKMLRVNSIPGIEVIMIKYDGTVIHFSNPKTQASLAANTFAITGHIETKQITDMLPSINCRLGPRGLSQLKELANGAMAEDNSDVPKLTENFEEASKKEVENITQKVQNIPVS